MRYKLISLYFLSVYFLSSCSQNIDESELNNLIDGWHKAATEADFEAYFGFMIEKSIFIGTDASERWNKKEFMEFALPHFEKGKAWDFKAYDRHIITSKSGHIAYFDELLDTWMGVCRGSGVLEFTGDSWKLVHYTLSVTIPNELIYNFIDLVDSEPKMDDQDKDTN